VSHDRPLDRDLALRRQVHHGQPPRAHNTQRLVSRTTRSWLITGVKEILSDARVYHSQTRLADGRPSLLIDPGSVGNLCGENWARSVAAAAK